MDANEYLGRTAYLKVSRHNGLGTVRTRAGISWKVVELDRSRNSIVLRSEDHWTRTRSPLDVFLRAVREGYLEVE